MLILRRAQRKHRCDLDEPAPTSLPRGSVVACETCGRQWIVDPIPWERSYRPARPWERVPR